MNVLRNAMIGAALLALAACGGTENHAGALPVGVQGPQGVRAVMFRLVGQHDTVTVPAGKPYRVVLSAGPGDSATVLVIANQGDLLTGAIAEIQLANVKVPPTFRVVQVASPSYTLLPDTAYTIVTNPQ